MSTGEFVLGCVQMGDGTSGVGTDTPPRTRAVRVNHSTLKIQLAPCTAPDCQSERRRSPRLGGG
eukprot:3150924-Prymnesium_polylepis.3